MDALNGELSDITEDEEAAAGAAAAFLLRLFESILCNEALVAKSGLLHNLDDTIDAV